MSGISMRPAESGRGLVKDAQRLLVSAQESATSRAAVLLIARVLIGWIFMYHGAGKLFDFKHLGGIAGTAAFFHFEGIPAPHFFAYVVGITEFFGGLLLIIGLAAPLVGLALAVDMLVAIFTSTGSVGMLPKAVGGGVVADGFEINLALLSCVLIIAVLGAGRFSGDSLLGLTGRRAPN